MNRQRGIADLWLVAIGLITVLALLGGITYSVKSYVDGVDAKAYARGQNEANSKWNAWEAQINADAATKIAAADARVRVIEQAGAAEVAGVRTDYAKQLKGKDNALKIALDALHAGTGKLYGHGDCAPSPANGGNPTSGPPGTAAGANGASRSQFSEQDSVFLLNLGSEADAVAIQLGKTQDLVAAYFKTCGPQAVK